MADFTTTGKELQGQILDTIRKSQDTMTDAIRAWAGTVQSMTPSLPVPSAPFADKLPTPSEVVRNAYDFAEQLLAQQRKFAEDVVDATTPVLTSATKGDARTAKAGAPVK
jgi:hypothetical protein